MAQAIIERACAKLRSAIGDEAVVRLNFTADLGDMLEELEHIQLFLEDAEMTQFRERSMWHRLKFVLTAAYMIIDTVDELQDARSQAATTVLHSNWPLFFLTYSGEANTTIHYFLSSPA